MLPVIDKTLILTLCPRWTTSATFATRPSRRSCKTKQKNKSFNIVMLLCPINTVQTWELASELILTAKPRTHSPKFFEMLVRRDNSFELFLIIFTMWGYFSGSVTLISASLRFKNYKRRWLVSKVLKIVFNFNCNIYIAKRDTVSSEWVKIEMKVI